MAIGVFGGIALKVLLPMITAGTLFEFAKRTVPETSFLMGYNYLRGTSAGFRDFVPGTKPGRIDPGLAPRS